MPTVLELKNIYHAYDKNLIIEDVSLSLNKGTIGCLLGHSGCGKTTVLRTIMGFENVLEGSILVDGETISSKDFSMPIEKRKIGMVFQDYALFPHMTVSQNIALALPKKSQAEKNIRIKELLETVHLTDAEKSFPHELSGGQQQRVALARALAPMPKLLLLDEPFSNLDVDLREKLSMEVRDIIKEAGITALLVTHHQHEAFSMADEIGIMLNGKIEQWDTAYNIYHKPQTSFIADFVGEGVILKAKIKNENELETGLGIIKGNIPDCYSVGDTADMLVRPEDIIHIDNNPLKGEIIKKVFRGPNILYTLKLQNGDNIMLLAPSHHEHPIGMKIGIKPEINDLVLFKRKK